jgi:ABC-type nitrate/sulfonate/bicarbonate transport system substrate-binding protein
VNNGTPRPITVHEHMIEQHFDLVVRFLEQTLRAADWASTNLPRTEAHPGAGDAGRNRGGGGDLSQRFPSLAPSRSVADRIEMLRNQANFLWYHGFLDEAVDVDRWIDARRWRPHCAAGRYAEAGSLRPSES